MKPKKKITNPIQTEDKRKQAFTLWCAHYFSWLEKVDPQDLGSHEMAWNAAWKNCKVQVMDIINTSVRNNPNLMSGEEMNKQSEMMEKIRRL